MGIEKCRVFQTDVIDPYRNLAAEELLLREVRPDELVLYLWQNDNTIVIGRSQDAYQECGVDEFRAAGGHIARRLSGGGAVFHDLGNLNFTFLVNSADYDLPRQMSVIQKAVGQFGILAEFTGRNDLVAGGRKFSGNAFYSNGKQRYHHGTILIAGDVSRMKAFLTPSKEKLASKGVQSVESRIVNLRDLNPAVTPDSMRTALIRSAEEVYGVSAEEGNWRDLPREAWDEKTSLYGSDDWILGTKSRYNREFRMRASVGDVTLRLLILQGRIADAEVRTDCMDPDWASGIRQKLVGTNFRKTDLRNAGVPGEIVAKMAE